MSMKQLGLWWALVDFCALTVYAIFTDGYFAFPGIAMEFATSSMWGAQIMADFMIALTIALGWVIADARKRDLPYWPFVLLTLTLGSIGPLAYLLHRERVMHAATKLGDGQTELQHA